MHHHGMRTVMLAVFATLALVVSGCIFGPPPSGPAPTRDTTVPPRPVIVDADMDISDIAALAILLRDPALDVRAIGVTGTGLVHCAGGLRSLGYILDELGREDVPYACGPPDGGPDARPFPDEWRVIADDAYSLDIPIRFQTGIPEDATSVLARAIAESPSAPTIIALGPWTNLEALFDAEPALVDQVAGIVAMLGTIDAPGNVYVDGFDGDDPLEWNAFADPSSVQAVLATDIPVDLVPLDATDDVPVPADLTERLAEDHAAAGADLMYELLVRHPARLLVDEGQQLWDELAALAVSLPDLVRWDLMNVSAGDDGRIERADDGRPVRVAMSADRPAVEAALLDALRRGGPRATPFSIAGQVSATWDGATCAVGVADPVPGVHGLEYASTTGQPGSVTIVRIQAPHTVDEAIDVVQGFDPESGEIPGWFVLAGQAVDESGSGSASAVVALEAASYLPVCLVGIWPEIEFVIGDAFTIAG